MNGGRSFLDTNVLVYTDDQDAQGKQRRARDLFADCRRRRSGVVSMQVLQECFVTATRKLGVAAEQARRKMQIFGRRRVVTPGLDDILGAIDLHHPRLGMLPPVLRRSAGRAPLRRPRDRQPLFVDQPRFTDTLADADWKVVGPR